MFLGRKPESGALNAFQLIHKGEPPQRKLADAENPGLLAIGVKRRPHHQGVVLGIGDVNIVAVGIRPQIPQ